MRGKNSFVEKSKTLAEYRKVFVLLNSK